MKRGIAGLMILICLAVIMAGCPKKTKKGKDKSAPAKSAEKVKCPEGMAAVPAGEFDMGCTDGAWCNPDERFVNAIKVDAFCMDKTEVTQKDYAAAMKDNPSVNRQCGDNCPVENVTWAQAMEYCGKVGKRLPTEAEWEKAARGKTKMRYPWGDTFSAKHAWYRENAEGGIHPVGKLQPNKFGLRDMMGNVAEWVRDYYEVSWYAQMPQENPVNEKVVCKPGDTNCTQDLHVVRGGSWNTPAESQSATIRDGYNVTSGFIGFRCAAAVK